MIPDGHQLRLAVMRRADALARARVDFTTFVEVASRDEKGASLVLAPHQLAWHAHLRYCWERGLHAGIMAPYAHGKSAGLIAPLAAFLLGRDPSRRIKIVCNVDGNARNRVDVVGRMLLSPVYRRIFPEVYKGGAWTQHHIYVNRPGWSPEPSVESKGLTSQGIGGRADVLLSDDCVDDENSEKPEQRKKVKNIWQDRWFSRLEPNGLSLWIGTPYNIDDLSYDLMAKPGWCFLIQRINESLTGIEQEVLGAGPDYPGLR